MLKLQKVRTPRKPVHKKDNMQNCGSDYPKSTCKQLKCMSCNGNHPIDSTV